VTDHYGNLCNPRPICSFAVGVISVNTMNFIIKSTEVLTASSITGLHLKDVADTQNPASEKAVARSEIVRIVSLNL